MGHQQASGRRPRGIGTVRVAGPSMSPTLKHGDLLLVRWRARPRPGDVVVFVAPDDGGWSVKRVGDGPVPALAPARAGTPPACWWLVGDNSVPGASRDSREYGGVPSAAVLGRVVRRVRPRWGRLPAAPDV